MIQWQSIDELILIEDNENHVYNKTYTESINPSRIPANNSYQRTHLS